MVTTRASSLVALSPCTEMRRRSRRHSKPVEIERPRRKMYRKRKRVQYADEVSSSADENGGKLYQKMLESGFDMHAVDHGSIFDFSSAEFLTYNLYLGSIDVNAQTNQGQSLLHWVCEKYDHDDVIDIVRILCKKGANVNFVHPKNGSNSLFALVKSVKELRRKPNVVICIAFILIEHNIDVDHENHKGTTILRRLGNYFLTSENPQSISDLLTLIDLFSVHGYPTKFSTIKNCNVYLDWVKRVAPEHDECLRDVRRKLIHELVKRGINSNATTIDGETVTTLQERCQQQQELECDNYFWFG